jgi:hypothetical protein
MDSVALVDPHETIQQCDLFIDEPTFISAPYT